MPPPPLCPRRAEYLQTFVPAVHGQAVGTEAAGIGGGKATVQQELVKTAEVRRPPACAGAQPPAQQLVVVRRQMQAALPPCLRLPQ